ncbi:hypothetical protein D3C72_2398990 [compost metagenome]
MRPIALQLLVPTRCRRFKAFAVHRDQHARVIGVVLEGVRAVDAAYDNVVTVVATVLAGGCTLRPGQHVEEGERILAARQ